jgi:phage repressor protein C with HTH and peptisase S24 domain
VYAGEPEMLYIEHHNETASFIYNRKDHRCFALRVSGKSMETTLKDGDVVLVDMDILPADGDLVAVKHRNGHQYIKRFKNLNYAFVQLSSDYSDYGIRVIDKNDIESIYPVVSINLNIRNGDRRN